MIIQSQLSNLGLRRQTNEDFFGNTITDIGEFHIVCDGMGGHVAGATASKLATESFLNFVNESKTQSIPDLLNAAIEYAGKIVYDASIKDTELKGMGTTLVVAVIQDNKLYYAHVGDSRLYLLQDRKLTQITEDHSFVAEMVKAGIITDQEAKIHPRKNEITRAIGIRPTVEPTICREPIRLQKGDYVLLCTDGLTNMVHEDTIQDIIVSNATVESKAQKLIDEANEAGGNDNITVTLIEMNDEPNPVLKNKRNWIFLSAFFTLILAAGWYIYSNQTIAKSDAPKIGTNEKSSVEEEKKMESPSLITIIETKKETPKKKKLSAIQYDLSCMTGKEDEGMMSFVNLMSQSRDDMVDVVADKVSPKKEFEYGNTVFKELSKNSEIRKNPKLTNMLELLLKNISKSDYQYSIYEIQDESINAFTVGGFIYVHTGMLLFVKSDDELAAIIAHEINHNELGHINKKLRMSETATAFVGKEAADIALAIDGIVTSSFNQKDETMCDLYGIDLMILAGYDPCAAIELWKRMATSESEQNTIDEMMRTHPYSSKRANCIKHHLRSNYDYVCD